MAKQNECSGLTPDTRLRTWRRGPFSLSLYSLGYDTSRGKERLGYRLKQKEKEVFCGRDLFASPLHGIDSDASAAAALSFLSLKPGDTDADYFDGYTPAQLEFAERYGDDLSMWSEDLEGK